MQKRNFLTAMILLTLITLPLASAITGSIGNARMILYPEVNGWTTTTIEKTILVKNVNNVSLNVTLQIDDKTSEFIELIDENFRLEPNQDKKAEFLVKVKKTGKYEGKVNVLFTPDEGTGIALSSTVIVIAKQAGDYEEGENIEDETGVNVLTGEAIENQSQNSSNLGPIFLSFSTLILIAILGYMIYSNKEKIFKKNLKEKSNKKTKSKTEKNEE